VRAAAGALRGLPAPVAYGLATALSPGVLAWILAHEARVARRGRGALRNLRIAYRDELTPARAARILAGLSRHLAWLVVDFCRMPLVHAGNVHAHMTDRKAEEEIRALLAEGRGLVAVTGHLGAWEMIPHLAAACGMPATVVARPLRSAPLDAWVREVRRAGGTEVVSKWRVLLGLRRALSRGRLVGLLVDEDARERPVFTPFLGTPAATHAAPAWLHRETGAPLAVITAHRVGRGRFEARIWDVIRDEPDAEACLRRVNAALSRAIRARPEQWLWGSRRFATRPPGEIPGPDGLPPPARSEAEPSPAPSRPV